MLSKKIKMRRLATLSLAVAGAMSVSHSVNAEGVDVSGSVGISNMYLWRGVDLGDGENGGGVPAVSGDLNVSAAGFYTGIWGSSGDANSGTEYDLYVGYGAEFGGVSVDLSVWNYMYPSIDEPSDLDDFGGLSEAVLSLGFAGFGVSVYDNIAGGSGYEYYTVSYSYDAFTVLAGMHDLVGGDENMTHVDVKYAFNDNLTFTLSQQVDGEFDDDLKFVVSYSLPIGE